MVLEPQGPSKTLLVLPLSHDITVEGIQDTFVSQLQRIVKHLQTFSGFNFTSVIFSNGFSDLFLCYFKQSFEFVSSIPEGAYSINIERVFPLAYRSMANLCPSYMNFFVSFSAVISQSFLFGRSLFLFGELMKSPVLTSREQRWKLFSLKLLLNSLKF